MARILIVDDDSQICRLLEKILELEGHQTTSASDGNEALRVIAADSFDLVITDLIMPEKEGLELIREVRTNHPEVRIIAMTGGGYGSAADYLSWAIAFGVCRTVMKPFSRAEILEAVSGSLSGG